MPEHKRYLRVDLKSPKDAQEYIRRLLSVLKQKGPDAEIEYLGRISQILGVWIKCYELTSLEEFDARIKALEEQNRPQEIKK